MFYVYLLRDNLAKLYIGYTADLKRRLAEHYKGKVYTSHRMNNPKLVYYEAFLNKTMAQDREKKLKQFGPAFHSLIKRFKL